MRRLLFLLLFTIGCNACSSVTYVGLVHPAYKITTDTSVKDVRPAGKPDSVGYLKLADAPIGRGQVMRYGYMDPYFRDVILARRWNDRPQNESGYCVTSWSVLVQNKATEVAMMELSVSIDSTFIVWDMQPTASEQATAESVTFTCPQGMPRAHVHPPETCKNDKDLATCIFGGFSGFQCQPSQQDLVSLILYGAPFGINICGPNQVRFYYPSDLTNNQFRRTRPPPDSLKKIVR